MSSTKSYSEIKDRSGNGLSPELYGSEYRNQISILNSNFLSSIEKALKKSPDACLAPLVMDYLQFLYPIVTSPQDSTLTGKLYSNDSIDFGTVAKFFQDLKSNMTSNSSGSSSAVGFGFGNSLRSGTGTNESSSLEKASVSTNKPFFSLPSPTVVASQRSSQTSTSTTSSLFGQPPNPVLHFNAPVSTAISSNLKTRLEFDSKTTSIFQNSVSSTLTNNTFGSSKMSTGTTTSSSASMSSTSTFPSALTSSSLPKSELSSIPSSSGTAKLTSFSFGSLSSSSTDPTFSTTTTTFGSNGFQNSGSSSAAFSKSLFGAPSGSGFGQTSFGASIAADAARLSSGPNGGTEATKEDSDDDSPPKPDHVPVVEKDSVYSQRVKLFEMEGKGFKDLGIGNLFIKQIDGGKHQLVVRADNSLGIILINVVLNASMPIRQNKPTNVLATIPNSEGKPVTYLLRVKEESVGNELFKNLEKYKNK